MLYLLALMLMM